MGDALRVTVEAIDVASNRILWQDTLDAPASSLLATQAQLTLRIRGGLGPALGATPGVEPPARPSNEEAYELYLRSVNLPLDPRANPEAIAMLERAVALDDGYPPLDPDYVPAVTGLALLQAERGDLAGAYRRIAALVDRRPDSADAHFALSYVLRFAGVLDEAADECEAALLAVAGGYCSFPALDSDPYFRVDSIVAGIQRHPRRRASVPRGVPRRAVASRARPSQGSGFRRRHAEGESPMAHTYEELKKKTVAELREMAKGLESAAGALHGARHRPARTSRGGAGREVRPQGEDARSPRAARKSR